MYISRNTSDTKLGQRGVLPLVERVLLSSNCKASHQASKQPQQLGVQSLEPTLQE